MPRELGRGDIAKDAARLRVLLASGGATTHSHADYVRIATADTITAVHTFDPPTATPFIILGVNAASQLITGLNADLLDGVHLAAIQSEIDTDIATHAAIPGAHHDPVTAGNAAISVTGQVVSVQLATPSGLGVDVGGLALAEGAAGAGMTMTSKVLNVIAADTSMTINADSIQVRLAATSGLQVSTGLMIADTIAGAGLTIASKVLAVGVSGLGLSTTADAVVLTSDATGAADAHIVATDASGYVTARRFVLPNDTGLLYWPSAGAGNGGAIQVSADDDMAINVYQAGSTLNIATRNAADSGYLQWILGEYSSSGNPSLLIVGQGYIETSSGSLNLVPAAGQSLNVSLSTTGDFIINTSQLVVDTSTGRVGIGTAAPGGILHMVGSVGATYIEDNGIRLVMTRNSANYIKCLDASGYLVIEKSTGAAIATFTTGVQIGTPTGGDKGAGTLNTSGDIYKNNGAFTNPDYALEMWRDGRIVKFADNPGAATYRRLTLAEIKQQIVTTLRLPGFGDEPAGIFKRGDLVLEKIEEIFTHLIEMNERLEAVEHYG